MGLADGRYDRLIDARLARAIAALASDRTALTDELEGAGIPHRTAHHIADVVRAVLPDMSADDRAPRRAAHVAVPSSAPSRCHISSDHPGTTP
jgi:hypothetical protein